MVSRLFWILPCLIFGLSLAHSAFCATPVECSTKLPPGLASLLAKKYPDFRLPRLADLDKQGVASDLSEKGDGCFVVASGYFEGKVAQDFALLLVPKSGHAPNLIVAMPRNKTWKIERLRSWCDRIANCYVKTEKRGTYRRSQALDAPPDGKDERQTLTSRHQVVLSGTLESTGVVYAYEKGRWLYVWESD